MGDMQDPATLAYYFISFTQRNVFLTGKAGTGKTTFLKNLQKDCHKRMLVAAPTGIAALNAGGVTLHSLFQLPFGGYLPAHTPPILEGPVVMESAQSLTRHMRMSEEKRKLIQHAELLVIDEVSMLRADLLDAIHQVLQTVRRSPKPFGGIQVLFIGDMMQLPPVVKDEEWRHLKAYYPSPYFFHARALQSQPPVYIELTTIYRQKDPVFTDLLNHIRYNEADETDIAILNQHYRPGFRPDPQSGYITLTTHNATAEDINRRELQALPGKVVQFVAEVIDQFPPYMYPCEATLHLKDKAQVMFIKNDPTGKGRFFNGKIGTLSLGNHGEVWVIDENGQEIEVSPYTWNHMKYAVDAKDGTIHEEILGTFRQFPLRLAWAITIHKSQGLSFDKAILDIQQVFAAGQTYVALSRLRSLEGLVLTSPFPQRGLEPDLALVKFTEEAEEQAPLDETLTDATCDFLRQKTQIAFNFRDLTAQWREVLVDEKDLFKATKGDLMAWAGKSLVLLNEWQVVGEKFTRQLARCWEELPVNYTYLAERFEAARKYFEAPLTQLGKELLGQLAAARKKKGQKAVVKALEHLDFLLLSRLQLFYQCEWMALSLRGDFTLNRQTMEALFPLEWRNQITDEEEDNNAEVRLIKKKKGKTIKGSSLEVTRALVKEKFSFQEIADTRQLAVSTVEGHVRKLLLDGELQPSDFMKDERLKYLQHHLEKFDKDLPMSELRAHLPAEFSWFDVWMGRFLAYPPEKKPKEETTEKEASPTLK